ncbi:MAG: hypothetical protein A2W31_06605 [Planctomycetes bacterium RBG_16_64_10]|nr:MAG: hypothetical protein A2W31_06605 [Planctomycetes bacterium RBG_16_64_10]
MAPPCWDCPKTIGEKRRCPETGRQAEWTERNWRTWACYWEHQAAGGAVDEIMRRNFGIIGEALADYQRGQQSLLLAVVCGSGGKR